AVLLLWLAVMLGPTVLAEDTPHFLRAVGVLPAAVILPAVGLSQLWSWNTLPSRLGPALVVGLLVASGANMTRLYFAEYARRPQTSYWFEGAARDLAREINAAPAEANVWVDRRYLDDWPAVRFLAQPEQLVNTYRPPDLAPAAIRYPARLYAWPYAELEGVLRGVQTPASVTAGPGSLAQGDREPVPYPLYNWYAIEAPAEAPALANFDNILQLRREQAAWLDEHTLQVDLAWSAGGPLERPLVAFVHVLCAGQLLGQSDHPPAEGAWPLSLWPPGLILQDRHQVKLPAAPAGQPAVEVGLYSADDQARLSLLDASGKPAGDSLRLTVPDGACAPAAEK
ncbi:MAG: hypothetical protein ACRDHL_12960, partial [Candidatus Promineifilaceae bacterium]